MKIGKIANSLKDSIKIQEESDTLEQWAKVSKIVWDKNKVPCLSKKNEYGMIEITPGSRTSKNI